MAAAGLLASWAAALFAAWAFIGGLTAQPPGHPARRSAARALVASGVAAAAATAALLALLLSGDVTISFVARTIALNVPAPYRVAALWSLPAGAVLPTAAMVAIAGVFATARARSSLGIAAAGAIVMALCAASLAAAPFATLPWVPTEGLGLTPALQHPWSVLGRVALSVAIALGAAGVVEAADHLADGTQPGRPAPGASTITVLTLAALAVAMFGTARGAFAAGVAQSPVPPAAWGGALVPAMVALVFAWQGDRRHGAASFSIALGALGLMSVVLLGIQPRAGGVPAVAVFAVVSLGAAASGAAAAVARGASGWARALAVVAIIALAGGAAATLWLAGGGGQWMGTAAQWMLVAGGIATALGGVASGGASMRRALWALPVGGVAGGALGLWLAPLHSPALGWSLLAGLLLAVAVVQLATRERGLDRLPTILCTLAAAGVSLGAAGEGQPLTSSLALAGGARGEVAMRLGAPVALAHQGVSRYQDRNAHVVAVALEPWRDARPRPLLSVEQREYVDSRDESLGPAVARPAILAGVGEDLRVQLLDVTADEGIRVQLTVVPFASCWTLALALLAVAVLVQVARGLVPSNATAPPGSDHE